MLLPVDAKKLDRLDHVEEVGADRELRRGQCCHGGTEVHYHSFGMVYYHIVHRCQCLEVFENHLQWGVVLVSVSYRDAETAVVHVLLSVNGVGEGILKWH